MLDWMQANTDLRLVSIPYPDYHPELPGAKMGFRAHFPVDFDGRALGPDVNLIREESPVASFLGIINWTIRESPALLYRTPGWRWLFFKMLARYFLDVPQRLHSRRDRFLTMGNALIGRLYYTAKTSGVPIWLNAAIQDLHQADGRVSGIEVVHEGRKMHIRARLGVMLAGGGFERNVAMRASCLPPEAADPEMSGSQKNNTGDCITIARKLGANTMNMDSAWWAPVFKVPGEDRGRLSAVERALPGCIMVNQAGRRYVNEASSYHCVGQAMIARNHPDAMTIPSYLICDSRFRSRYPIGPLLPIPLAWHSAAVRSIVTTAPTPSELAKKLGIPANHLISTIEHFNHDARQGKDTEFNRGASAYDRYCGDARVQPNPSLAPLEVAPFYAVPLYLGDIGTNGGLVIDDHARVLDTAGHPIPGLYAAGNTTASVMGYSYPAPGATLGPALTFAFLAVNHMLRSLK
jgi:3-oxosteroid 1-dehydrogenase